MGRSDPATLPISFHDPKNEGDRADVRQCSRAPSLRRFDTNTRDGQLPSGDPTRRDRHRLPRSAQVDQTGDVGNTSESVGEAPLEEAVGNGG